VENLSARDKMRIFCTLSLSYETSRAQLETVLGEAGTMLRQHPRVESSTAWIRLANLSGSGLELEMQAYVLTRDYDDYTAVREDILLRVMNIVERCGSPFTSLAQTVRLATEPQAAEAKTPAGSKH